MGSTAARSNHCPAPCPRSAEAWRTYLREQAHCVAKLALHRQRVAAQLGGQHAAAVALLVIPALTRASRQTGWGIEAERNAGAVGQSRTLTGMAPASAVSHAQREMCMRHIKHLQPQPLTSRPPDAAGPSS